MSYSRLGPDWVRGADGLRERRAARVIVLDERGRVLLVRGHDDDQPDRTWWFTVGGGIEPGESEREAAVRELAEETGLRLDAEHLIGPVLTRSAVFDFFSEHCRQHEAIFLARVPGTAALSVSGWTALEREVVDELAWWEPGDLREASVEVFPAGLADLVADLHAGWDGVTRHLSEERGGQA
ncbi:NUDIX hydrolase [Serinibacter salmoneus]|uniref:ADP-ribose pyrophosphatase YjhB (NUDIX family) n=1 Tax=Serinibacter salmoneus TaxID=556530 RepID=A0A2A9CZQ3_9MICO|nr:NUDIX domain-containing protein [Serinibacter salmoneus]PFG19606.1 ADP-ribose pyrophosphatase YjhB (NUDIX family) [Serinibacter salmoneus]